MKRGKTFDWIPLYVDKWIFGSTRIELTHEERAIWIDFLALASKDDGYIRANKETPYPLQQLAGMLCCEMDLLTTTIAKFASKEIKKIKVYKNGIIYLLNWEEYKLTPRHKRRFEIPGESEHVRENGHDVQKGGHYTETETKTKIDTEIYNEIRRLLTKVKGISEEKAKNLTYFIIDELRPDFPELDILEQVKKKCAWWLDKPITKKSNIHAQMRNWFKLGQKWIDEAKAQDQVGRPKKTGIKTTEMIDVAKVMNDAEAKVLKENPGKRGREIECLIMAARAKASQEYWRKKGK